MNIVLLDNIDIQQVYTEMPYKELLKRRMNDSECGKQAQLIGKMVRYLFEETEEFTKEELNIVDTVRIELQDKFNKEWYSFSKEMRDLKDKRYYIEWRKENEQ